MINRFKTGYLWLVLICLLVLTFFTRENIRGVTQIDPAAYGPPRQTAIQNPALIKFTQNNYEYELTPLFNYQISGLIVHKLNYWFDN